MQGFKYTNIAANTAGTLVKTGAGVLRSLTINSLGTTDTVTLYDGTSTGGTKIATINDALALGTLLFDAAFQVGLFVVVAGTTTPDITLAWL